MSGAQQQQAQQQLLQQDQEQQGNPPAVAQGDAGPAEQAEAWSEEVDDSEEGGEDMAAGGPGFEGEDAEDDDEDSDDDSYEDASSQGAAEDEVVDPIKDRCAGKLGCEHYRRRAMIVAPCCNKPYWCRHCHNAVCNDNEQVSMRPWGARHCTFETCDTPARCPQLGACSPSRLVQLS